MRHPVQYIIYIYMYIFTLNVKFLEHFDFFRIYRCRSSNVHFPVVNFNFRNTLKLLKIQRPVRFRYRSLLFCVGIRNILLVICLLIVFFLVVLHYINTYFIQSNYFLLTVFLCASIAVRSISSIIGSPHTEVICLNGGQLCTVKIQYTFNSYILLLLNTSSLLQLPACIFHISCI